jgi:hypothetical protein
MRALHRAVRLVSILACLGAASAFAEPPSEKFKGWELEQGVEPPSYDHLGLTIETVSRTLTQFARDGLIKLASASRSIVLADKAALRRLTA